MIADIVSQYWDVGSLKVLWSSAQILASIPITLAMEFPSPFQELTAFIGAVTKLDAAESIGVGCVDYRLGQYTVCARYTFRCLKFHPLSSKS